MILVRLHARDRLPWDYLWLNEVFSMIDNALETMLRREGNKPCYDR